MKFRNFVRWLSRGQSVTTRRSQRRQWAVQAVAHIESLELRIVLSGEPPILTRVSNDPPFTFTIYEDRIGDGLTPDDQQVPFQLTLTRRHEQRDYYRNELLQILNAREITFPNGSTLEGGWQRIEFEDTNRDGKFIPYFGVDEFGQPEVDEFGRPVLRFEPVLHYETKHYLSEYESVTQRIEANGQRWIRTSRSETAGKHEQSWIREFSVKGTAYEDLNGNGTRDVGEPAFRGRYFVDYNNDGLDNDNEGIVLTPLGTRIDSKGISNFDGSIDATLMGRGPIVFDEVPVAQVGGQPLLTITEGKGRYSAPSPSQGDLENVTFGVFRNGIVQGNVFDDLDRDKVFHPARGDRPSQGTTMWLEQNGKLTSTTTDADGYFQFFAKPGPYRVFQDLSGLGVTQTLPVRAEGYRGSITRSGQEDRYTFQFGRFDREEVVILDAVREGATSVGFDYGLAGNTGPVTVSVYRSMDTIYQKTDPLLATVTLHPVNGRVGHVVVPLGDDFVLDQVRRELLVVADPGNKIKEVDETNNVQVVRGGRVSLTDADYLGSKDTVRVTTTSAGNESSYYVGFFRSANDIFDPHLDKLIGGKWLATAGTHTITFKPPKDDPSLPYLFAVLDPQRGIKAGETDRVRVVDAPPDVRISAKFVNGLVEFSTAFVTELAASAAALATAKKKGVSVARNGADGVALDEDSRFSLGVFFSSDTLFDALDTLVGPLRSITNSHTSGSVNISNLRPSGNDRYVIVVADTGAIHSSDYDPTDNTAIVAGWEGPAVINATLDVLKRNLTSAKSKIDELAVSFFEQLLETSAAAGGTVADSLHRAGQMLWDFRQKLAEARLELVKTQLKATEWGSAAFERFSLAVGDQFDSLLRPLLPKEVLDAGESASNQIATFVDQYLRPVVETAVETTSDFAELTPGPLELAEKILFTSSEKIRNFSLDPITGTFEFAGNLGEYVTDTGKLLQSFLAAPFRGFYYMAFETEKVLPALGFLFAKSGEVIGAAGEYAAEHPTEVRTKLVNGIADYLTSGIAVVDLVLLPVAMETYAPRIWTAFARGASNLTALAQASPRMRSSLSIMNSVDAALQASIKEFRSFADAPVPSASQLSRYAPSEAQVEKFAKIRKAIEEGIVFSKADLQVLANQATGAERTNYQKLISLLDSADPSKGLLDSRQTLEQLANTRSSRTAKQLESAEQTLIIRTRAESVYGPADDATIAAIKESVELRAFKATHPRLLESGWELKMDTFSTPGKLAKTVGADRDARLVFQRANPAVAGGFERIEVPLGIWEKRAYADFRMHATQLYGGDLPTDIAKLVDDKVDELKYLMGGRDGLTAEQVQDRAFAEVHNQLFTDRFHIEASAANSDQLAALYAAGAEALPPGTPLLPRQTYANVLATKDGSALLRDPIGYSLMWREKIRFYSHNPAEAIAQAQKGIREYFEIRAGYAKMRVKNASGADEIISIDLPQIPDKTRGMMTLILDTPVGIDATDAVIGQLTQQLKAFGARNLQSALQEVVGSVASLQNVKLPRGISFNVVGPQ